MGQGESLATSPDSLVQRQSPCRATSDGKRRQKTPGVDGHLWDTPEKKARPSEQLRQRGYRPTRCGASTFRRMMARIAAPLVDPHDERPGDAGALPARPRSHRGDAGRSELLRIPQGAIDGGRHRAMLQRPGTAACAQWILEGDIRACFDRISHEWLLAHIPMEKAILQKWLKAGFMEKHVLSPTEAGAPQGGIGSPVMANLALDGLERLLRARYPPNTNAPNAPK